MDAHADHLAKGCSVYCDPLRDVHCETLYLWQSSASGTIYPVTPETWRREIERNYGRLLHWEPASEAEPPGPGPDSPLGRMRPLGTYLIWYEHGGQP